MVDRRRGIIHTHGGPTFRNVTDYSDHFKDYDDICVNEEGPMDMAWDTDEKSEAGPGVSNPTDSVAKWSRMVAAGSRSSDPGGRIPDIDKPGNQQSRRSLTTELSDHQLLLLFPLTRAFALKTKQWSKSLPLSEYELTALI